MGKTMMGGISNQSLITPQQQQYMNQAGQGYGQMAQGMSPEEMQAAYQKSVVDPSMQTYNQQIVPGLQQRFVDAGAGSSSALNQALAGSAENLTTSLQGGYIPFMQGQQSNQLQALSGLGGLAGQRTFQPYQQQGLLNSLIGAGGQLGAASIGGGGDAGLGALKQLLSKILGNQQG